MAFIHGKSASFKVDNSSGTLTDISSYCDEIGFPRAIDTAETTTFGNSAKTYIVGLTDATISVSGKFDSTADAVLAGIVGQAASVSFEYKPNSSSGPTYTGECYLTSYEVSSPVGDVVTFSAEFQVTGAITRA